MKKKSIISLICSIVAILMVMTSCNKKNDNTYQSDDAAEMVNESFVENTFDELQDIADQAYEFEVSGVKSTQSDFLRFGDCVTINLDTTIMPRVLTIDFGEENCLCRDGKYRRGQIITTFTGRYRQAGTIITHGFSNYYVNDNHIEGSKVIENMGLNEDNQIWYTINVNGQVTLNEDETVLTWVAERTRTWVNGFFTPRWIDDVLLIEGSGTFSNSNGFGRSMLITSPLRRELSCPHFVSGTVEITPLNLPARILDYGEGECDNIATVTVGDRTFTIRLR